MIIINDFKNKLESCGLDVFQEDTCGNYDDKGDLIKGPVLTLTTKHCEIGFYENSIYFVFIADSNSWNDSFYTALKEIQPFQVYGFEKFTKNYNFSKDIDKQIKSEPYFQIQFNNKSNQSTIDYLFNLYNNIVNTFERSNVVIINQLTI